MADSECSTRLLVAFWHEDKIEASFTVAGPDAALRAARVLLDGRDGLYDGDEVTVDAVPQQTLTDRGLA